VPVGVPRDEAEEAVVRHVEVAPDIHRLQRLPQLPEKWKSSIIIIIIIIIIIKSSS
jgi:hypothetical protein